jgi:GNAT superfamily N-acetyltransferase
MQIRLATSSDITTILSMGIQMHAESRFKRYPMNPSRTQEAIETLLSNSTVGCILLAEHPQAGIVGMLAGYVTDYFFTDIRLAQDKWFYVIPEHRGSSAALKLLIAFRRWAENRQAKELCINMSVAIDQARFNKFMTHLGFQCAGSNFVMPLQTSSVS